MLLLCLVLLFLVFFNVAFIFIFNIAEPIAPLLLQVGTLGPHVEEDTQEAEEWESNSFSQLQSPKEELQNGEEFEPETKPKSRPKSGKAQRLASLVTSTSPTEPGPDAEESGEGWSGRGAASGAHNTNVVVY